MATGTSDCGRTTGTGGQKVFSINVVQPMMFGEPSPNRKLRTRFVVDVKSVFDSWPWEHNEVGGSHDPIQANCKSQAQSSMGMDLSKGFQIEEPCVFVPGDTSESQFLAHRAGRVRENPEDCGYTDLDPAGQLARHRSKRVNAFHEKAGRSQVNSLVFLFDKVFLPPSSHCRHASIRTLEERICFARCTLGVLVSRCHHLIGDLSFHPRVKRGPGD